MPEQYHGLHDGVPDSAEQNRSPAQSLPIDDIHARLEKALSATETFAGLIRLGDLHLQAGRLDLALSDYAVAGAKSKLLDLADRCLDEARVDLAEQAYRAAGFGQSKD